MADPSSSGPHSFDPADRRDSPRVPMKFHVRASGQSDFQEVEGDLSVGGALFHSRGSLEAGGGKIVDVKFRLPTHTTDVVCQAEVLRVRDDAQGKRFHLKFVELPLESELAIAKYIDDLIASLGT